MTSILFAPHQDDETLFAAYTILRVKPVVVTVFGEACLQEMHGIYAPERNNETARALWHLGEPDHVTWPIRDDGPDWVAVRAAMLSLAVALCPTWVYAPMVEEDDGHAQHDGVGRLALEVFEDRVVPYATYRRGFQRTRTDNEVTFEPDWPARKFRAMACYRSQLNLATSRPWFSDWDREWHGS